MTRWRMAGITVGVAAIFWAGVAAQQEVQSRPGPGTGLMNVNVVNHPAVTAAQSGEWQMAVTNVPNVRLANAVVVTAVQAPRFITTSRTYVITWATGEKERIVPREMLDNGWIRVEHAPGDKWINLESARSIEEAK